MLGNILESLAILLFCGLLCFTACGMVSGILPGDFLVARKTMRSNHSGSPRQLGGLALVPSTFMAALIIPLFSPTWSTPPVAASLALTMAFLLGFADDWKGLGVKIRLAAQLAIAAILVISSGWLDAGFSVYVFIDAGFAIYVIHLATLALIATTYWINAVNFMDGLDWMLVGGLTVPMIFHAVLLAHTGSATGSGAAILALCAAGCLIGFACWNRPPAKLFMGDSGSLFLGALSAFAILQVATAYGLLIAITPFLYFLMDTTSTIILRLAGGENILRAHSRHAYQVAYRNGWPARRITTAVAILNLSLVALGIVMLTTTGRQTHAAFALACLVTGIFILHLHKNHKA